jgi:HME family heavy-metal exporter
VSQIVEEPTFRRCHASRRSDRSTTGLGDLLIATPSGHVPLRMLAEVEKAMGPIRSSENAQRRVAVFGNGDGKGDMVAIIATSVGVAESNWPQGHTTQLEGTFQARRGRAADRRAVAAVVARSSSCSTAATFDRAGPIIMANIPLALIGSVIALAIAGQSLSIASMIGFITLAGISARNGILKISHYINLVLHEGEQFGRALVIRGSLERLTPVLMTALSAGLALIPLLFGADEAGREILHPVAVTIFGGLLSATALDTLPTPLLFRHSDATAPTPDGKGRADGMATAEAY